MHPPDGAIPIPIPIPIPINSSTNNSSRTCNINLVTTRVVTVIQAVSTATVSSAIGITYNYLLQPIRCPSAMLSGPTSPLLPLVSTWADVRTACPLRFPCSYHNRSRKKEKESNNSSSCISKGTSTVTVTVATFPCPCPSASRPWPTTSSPSPPSS